MRSPESWEKAELDAFLKKVSGIWWFKPFMAGYGKSGVPDYAGVYRGHWFSIEVKREGKEPTPIQWKRMREIETAGGKCFWGTSEKVVGEIAQWLLMFAKADRNLKNQPRPKPASGAVGVQLSPIPGFLPEGSVGDDPVSPAGTGGRRSK